MRKSTHLHAHTHTTHTTDKAQYSDLLYSSFEDFVYPWSQHHRHPSAGAFMATVDNMERFMLLLLQDYDEQRSLRVKRIGTVIWDDQLALRELHRRWYPRIKVDTLSLVFTVQDDNIYNL